MSIAKGRHFSLCDLFYITMHIFRLQTCKWHTYYLLLFQICMCLSKNTYGTTGNTKARLLKSVNMYIAKVYVPTGCPIWIRWILKSYHVLFFGVRQFSLHFLCWKHVYILISKINTNSKDPSYELAQFSNFLPNPNLKNQPNHRTL